MTDYGLSKTICFMLCVVYVLGYGNETALRTALQTGYNRFSRPTSPTNVSFHYNLRTLEDLDITTETMTHVAIVRLEWEDPRLTWDPTQYDNITNIVIDWGWRPEFNIGNSEDEVPFFGNKNEETRIRAYSSGLVMWGVFFSAETACKVQTDNFPYDEQTCNVEIDFLMDDYGDTMIVHLLGTEVDTSFFLQNGEWKLEKSHIDIVKWTLCCPTQLPFLVDIQMTFIRRQPYYIMNILIPIILLSFCVPWAFYINTESGRVSYAVTMLLSYFLFLAVFVEIIPSTSLQIPVLARYLLVVLVVCMASMIQAAIQVKLYFLETKPNKLVRRVHTLLKMMLTFECCNKKHKPPFRPVTAVTQYRQPLPEQEKGRSSQISGSGIDIEEEITWKCVSVTVDRFLFYFYNVVVVICNMFLVIALYG